MDTGLYAMPEKLDSRRRMRKYRPKRCLLMLSEHFMALLDSIILNYFLLVSKFSLSLHCKLYLCKANDRQCKAPEVRLAKDDLKERERAIAVFS